MVFSKGIKEQIEKQNKVQRIRRRRLRRDETERGRRATEDGLGRGLGREEQHCSLAYTVANESSLPGCMPGTASSQCLRLAPSYTTGSPPQENPIGAGDYRIKGSELIGCELQDRLAPAKKLATGSDRACELFSPIVRYLYIRIYICPISPIP